MCLYIHVYLFMKALICILSLCWVHKGWIWYTAMFWDRLSRCLLCCGWRLGKMKWRDTSSTSALLTLLRRAAASSTRGVEVVGTELAK